MNSFAMQAALPSGPDSHEIGKLAVWTVTSAKPGNGVDKPSKGDSIIMEYTGWLLDDSKPDKKGNK